jgi:hypothetical protein
MTNLTTLIKCGFVMEPFPSLGWIIDLYCVFRYLIQFAVSFNMKSATGSARKIVFFVFD